jgi:hypothetical protein
MQIHEITKQRTDEGILDTARGAFNKLKSGVQGAAQGYRQSQLNRSTAAMAAKASGVWQQYAQQLKASTPDPARYANLYRQALTAFVQKNLLAGQSINNAINRQEITQLINNISASADNPQTVNQLFGQLVKQAALSQPEVRTGDEIPTAGATDQPATDQTASAQVSTTYQVPLGKRIRVQTLVPGAEQPSFYYKKPDGSWENQLGQKVETTSYPFLEKLISAAKGARIETDPDAPVEEPVTKGRGKKSRQRTK